MNKYLKYIAISLLFYLFAILQNSFFAHFLLFGGFLNLVFIFFFIFTFFKNKEINFDLLFYAIAAGFFSDVFLDGFFGISIIAFLVISFLLKKVQGILASTQDAHPVVYFIPLFIVCFLCYKILAILFSLNLGFTLQIFWELIYNAVVATIVFLIFKKIGKAIAINRQLSLF